MANMVNHPYHYNLGGRECIEVIEDTIGCTGTIMFCYGNVIKYLFRAGHKDDEIQDLKKAIWYFKYEPNYEKDMSREEYIENYYIPLYDEYRETAEMLVDTLMEKLTKTVNENKKYKMITEKLMSDDIEKLILESAADEKSKLEWLEFIKKVRAMENNNNESKGE